MKTMRYVCLLLLTLLALFMPGSALAQTYLFSLDQLTVHYFINEDGSVDLDYTLVFTNNPGASPIDYVDVGTPNSSFSVSKITADVDGKKIGDISASGYQGSGTGVALGLGGNAIRPGARGTVHVRIPGLKGLLYPDSSNNSDASTVFSPTWFGSQYVEGNTDMTVVFHLPPGVQPDEPRWHKSPSGFPEQPWAAIDEQGRITYTWKNNSIRSTKAYEFGASFPGNYVPANAIVKPSFWEVLGINPDELIPYMFCFCFAAFWVGSIGWGIYSSGRRKLQYLPPKVAIEGHGIKRGLTAVESAVLMEQPMDKILTMILFAVIKKGAASVVQREPLQLDITRELPSDLHDYELDFLAAFDIDDKRKRRVALQEMMTKLIKGVSSKMKGFSRRETLAYYKDIMERAWAQVEAANTPEVKSEKYDEVMEWTMLDRDYERRTRDVFHHGPVIVPMWWGRYDPTWRAPATGSPIATSQPISPGGGGFSKPTLPGAAFAANMVNGVQNFSAGVIGNLSEFTSGITNKTNPIPVSRSSGGGSRSGGGCACACACAGCACACAGGGR